MRFKRTYVDFMLIFVQLGFASLHVEGKLVMNDPYNVSPFSLAMMRIGGAAIVFITINLMFKSPKVIKLKDIGLLCILAVLGIINNQLLYLYGLKITSSISATLLVAMVPVFVVLISAALRLQKLRTKKTIGIIIAFFGICILIDFQLPKIGDTLVLLNALSFALYIILSKNIIERLGTIAVMAWIFGISALFCLPFGVNKLIIEAPLWSNGAILLILYVVMVPTILVYLANAWALSKATPGKVAVYMFLQPLAVILLLWIQLGKHVSMQVFWSALISMIGVSLVLSSNKKRN